MVKNVIKSKDKTIKIAHLYPDKMNVYGDMGNISTLIYRLEARGYKAEYMQIDSAQDLKGKKPDIIVGGGGQDSNQEGVQRDLLEHAGILKELHGDNVVGLMVCGMYQLFGKRLSLTSGLKSDGVGIFSIETVAGDERLIGNIVIESKYGKIVGFENHSGLTELDPSAIPLGHVIKGAGNNGNDGTEGVVSKNMFGTYMHGPVLAKNPVFADELIHRAISRRYGSFELEPIDDSLEIAAAKRAALRPR